MALYFGRCVGAFAKFRNATISFMYVHLSAWNNSDPTGRIFMKFDMIFFGHLSRKIQVLLNSDDNNA